MVVTLTPNVRAAVRTDPVLATVIDLLRKEPRQGYLHLSRSTPTSPFHALFVENDDTRHEALAVDVTDAILQVLT